MLLFWGSENLKHISAHRTTYVPMVVTPFSPERALFLGRSNEREAPRNGCYKMPFLELTTGWSRRCTNTQKRSARPFPAARSQPCSPPRTHRPGSARKPGGHVLASRPRPAGALSLGVSRVGLRRTPHFFTSPLSGRGLMSPDSAVCHSARRAPWGGLELLGVNVA